MLARNSADFEDMGAKAAEGMIDVLENLIKYLDWQETETELLKSAAARFTVVLEAYLIRVWSYCTESYRLTSICR